jgi:hypothetical protein
VWSQRIVETGAGLIIKGKVEYRKVSRDYASRDAIFYRIEEIAG